MTEAQKCLYHIAENMRMDKSISKEGYEYFQQAIKALEQDSVLDKIRAEIIENAKSTMNDTRAEGLYMALNIVDKYKAESEDKES